MSSAFNDESGPQPPKVLKTSVEIIATLRKEYVDLAAKEFDAGFRFTDDTYIDTGVVEEILAPYKTAQ